MRRFLSRVLPLLLSFGLIFNCTGCSTVLVLAGKARENSEASSSVISESSASSGVISTPVPTEDGDLRAFYTDVANAESVTVMVYMIGSDLESEDGSATDDLLEMADAALSENVHLVLQTGGTETWWNDVCTDDESERFVIENGDMTLLQSLGSMNMTDADTLSDFIRFSAESYPADRYELILWDHGGGTMTGFGYDELYEDTSLTLSSLSTALYNGGVQFDFIGFDACLMATAEVAYALDPYADYLIASEESEPGEGWAYKNWLTMLAEDPAVPTAELGKKLADDFLEAYIFADMPTLSVLDLRYVPAELNGSTDIEIVLRWDSDHDSGFVAGYRLKTEEPTVAAKGLHSFTETDQIQYTCSYYDYDFNYDRDYTLGDPVTYTSEPVVTYEEIGEYRTVIQYTLRDIYNNEHFTDPVELSCE